MTLRVRAQDANGDYTFGRGSANFLVDSPQTVGQLVLTGMRLMRGEWFLDQTIGMPWTQDVIGKGKAQIYDLAIQRQILSTLGVTGISAYTSQIVSPNPSGPPGTPMGRKLSVTVTVDTIFGQAEPITVVL